ncbi:MAG: hypothetical protein DRP89_03070 [Candidatus Neomarinimicrobiota bacterium]|nr:MAG: hypothetical protein DRP89_03070 [Candidatus Neomarinimicrobiota bacterium]
MVDINLSVVGFGNRLYADDGIGLVVLEHLEKVTLPDGVETVYGGTDGFVLIDLFRKKKRVLIIDAVKMGKKPGDVCIFELDADNLNIIEDHISFHSFGLSEILNLTRQLKIEPKAKITGIEPMNLKLGDAISPEVEKKIPEIVRKIVEECKSYV